MKTEFSKRIEKLENAPGANLEPVHIRVVYEQDGVAIPAKEWTQTRSAHPTSGREIIVEWPK